MCVKFETMQQQEWMRVVEQGFDVPALHTYQVLSSALGLLMSQGRHAEQAHQSKA